MELSGRKFRDVIDQALSIGLDLEVRCRKCPECLRARSYLWRLRAQAETARANRTWFGTLTLSPTYHAEALSLARSKEADTQIDFDQLDEDERFGSLCQTIGKELTRYIKRVRKESGATLRSLLVVEKHKSGIPHFHMLVHEPFPTQTVGERTLRTQWKYTPTWSKTSRPIGHTKWKLADARSAAYVCKYIAKCSEARIRASLHYGSPPPIWDRESFKTSPVKNRPPKNHTFIGTDLEGN